VPLHAQVTDDIHFIYPTPVIIREVPDAERINAGLRAIVLERRRLDPGQDKSNYGGWHSTEDLFTWPHPEIHELLQQVADAVKSMTVFTTGGQPVHGRLDVVGWANVSGRGDLNKPHSHPGSMWSGVYYVDPGTPAGVRDDEGALEFLDPRGAIDALPTPGAPFSADFRISPLPGMLVLFPAWLVHMVNRFDGEGERISIAFNATIAGAPSEPMDTDSN